MKKLSIFILSFLFISCDKEYNIINEKDFQALSIQDTLLKNKEVIVMKVGKSISDEYPKLLMKKNQLDSKNYYLFKDDCEMLNDSIILSYYSAFIYEDGSGFRKNGIWVYTEFYKEGIFPFTSKGRKFSVDSIPKNWNKKVPKNEGIYFYKNNSLHLISKEQSEDKFKEYEKDGFYFFPNSGRLYDRINIRKLR